MYLDSEVLLNPIQAILPLLALKSMKRHITIIVFTFLICLYTFGHSGRTDKNGGHYNHKTGKYHYHNGSGSGLFGVVIVGSLLVFLFLKSGDNKKK